MMLRFFNISEHPRSALWKGFGASILILFVLVSSIYFGLRTFTLHLGPPNLGKDLSFSILVTDRNGSLLRPFITKTGYWRLPVKSDDVDPNYIKMLVAYEDKRFYHHFGIDPLALLRAAGQAIRNGRFVSGGSTLTMQVARLLEPRPKRSLSDKCAEIIRALQIETLLSKEEILNLYLALAPYGGNIQGVRAASLAYFGKEPNRLSVAQSALLVALPQSPEKRRPDRNASVALLARNQVIERLKTKGILHEEQAQSAKLEEGPNQRLPFPMHAPHLAERLVASSPDSLVLSTTLSKTVQSSLENLAKEHASSIGSGVSVAIIAVDNSTGEVRAHVGGSDYFDTKRAGQLDLSSVLRSPGSALKPFIYGLAFEDGILHPETLIEDRPIRYGSYAPENFDDAFHGTVTVRTALQQSLNVPALEVLEAVGPDRLVARLFNAGITVKLPSNAAPGLAVGLGGAGIRLIDLVQLYLSLARGGDSVPLVWQVQDQKNSTELRRLFETSAIIMINDILLGSPTPENVMGGKVAFKTGTSYGYRDAWAVGYDSSTTIGVWVGRPDASSVSGLIGRTVAAPILFDAFHRAGFSEKALSRMTLNTSFLKTLELPPSLQRFRPHDLPEVAEFFKAEAPLSISYPPDGARIDISSEYEFSSLALKVIGGVAPFSWIANGIPILQSEDRRETWWDAPELGFSRLTVIDAKGKIASAYIKIE